MRHRADLFEDAYESSGITSYGFKLTVVIESKNISKKLFYTSFLILSN